MAGKKKGGAGDGPNWMDTYGDLITLLMCFFVLLYSMSTMDQSKWQYIAQAFSTGSGDIINVVVSEEKNENNDPDAVYTDEMPVEEGAEEIDFDDFYMYLQEAVMGAGLDESVSVEMSETGVYMKFRDSVFFAGDSDTLLEEGQYILEVVCDGIRAVDSHVLSIKVSGHTAESNSSSADEWRLSSGRADSVINYMLSLDCCSPEKFSSAGYAKYRPIESNDTPEGRATNRRVEIVFIRNDVDFDDPAVVEELLKLEFGETFVNYSSNEDTYVQEDSETEENVEQVETVEDETQGYYSRDEFNRTVEHVIVTSAAEEDTGETDDAEATE